MENNKQIIKELLESVNITMDEFSDINLEILTLLDGIEDHDDFEELYGLLGYNAGMEDEYYD